MKFLALAAALVVGVAAAGPLQAKGTFQTAKGTPPLITVITSAPLIVRVGDDHSFQVFNTDIGNSVGQIFPSGSPGLADMGWFVRVNGVLTAPSFEDHTGGTATGSATTGIGPRVHYGSRTVTPVSGSGTLASPFTVSVRGTTSTGLLATQTVTYVVGDNFFRKEFRLDNPSTVAVDADIFLASDIYLANSDLGIPFQDPLTGAPGGQSCGITPPFTILHVSQGLPPTRITAAQYASVWTQIAAGTLNNTITPATCAPLGIDNGAGLQWRVIIPASGSASVLAATSFGEIPGAPYGYGDPVWNYSVQPQPAVAPAANTCIRNRFPYNRDTNAYGWAPSEGQFYHEGEPGGPLLPPEGLARAILDCYVNAWDDAAGYLYFGYCWADRTPWYIGTYEDQRQAQFLIYQATGPVCTDPPPPEATIFEGRVSITRRLYFPPLGPPPTALLQDGFE